MLLVGFEFHFRNIGREIHALLLFKGVAAAVFLFPGSDTPNRNVVEWTCEFFIWSYRKLNYGLRPNGHFCVSRVVPTLTKICATGGYNQNEQVHVTTHS